jgi:hypothetical protein
MKTLTIEIKNSNALRLLRELEIADIIKIIDDKNKSDKNRKDKLSKRIRGKISKERAEELLDELSKSREEWKRNI